MADNPVMRRMLRAAMAGLGFILDPLLGLVLVSTALARRRQPGAK